MGNTLLNTLRHDIYSVYPEHLIRDRIDGFRVEFAPEIYLYARVRAPSDIVVDLKFPGGGLTDEGPRFSSVMQRIQWRLDDCTANYRGWKWVAAMDEPVQHWVKF